MVVHLTMVHNTQKLWVTRLCPFSGILINKETERFGKWIVSVLISGEGDIYSLGSFTNS
jgi:hypothetical protein